ncbi:MAG: maltotransferase domain-containing protein, partial [Acidimicrobiales bacterium]
MVISRIVALGRIVIDEVRPRTPSGDHPAKVVAGQPFAVSADVFADGHDLLAARAVLAGHPDGPRSVAPLSATGNDRFEGWLTTNVIGRQELVVEAWRDRWASWVARVSTLESAGEDLSVDLEEGAQLLQMAAGRSPGT